MKIEMRALRIVFLAALVGCGAEPQTRASDADSTSPDTVVLQVVPPSAARAVAAAAMRETAPDCIRGGSTREEVRAVMGEPDSISFGAWIYGRASVTFGYGTVVDLDNEGGTLVVCRDD